MTVPVVQKALGYRVAPPQTKNKKKNPNKQTKKQKQQQQTNKQRNYNELRK